MTPSLGGPPVFPSAVQSLIRGNYSGNNNSNNTNTKTINNNYYGAQVPSYVPETFEELIAGAGWGASPPEIDQDHLRDKYNLPQDNTGKWIFEEAEYREWQGSSESRLLWICGGPGTGKTMLAKRVAAEFLEGLDDPPNDVKFVFHFVTPELPTDEISADEAGLSQLRLAKVASDLLHGILQQDGNLFDGCNAELGKQGDRFFTNPCSLWKVLGKAVRDCQTDSIYILIDGIDGLKEGLCRELIGRILDLMEIRTVKVFLSSREVPHVSNILSGNLPNGLPRCARVNLDMDNPIREDVKSFIERSVDELGWDGNIKKRAKEALFAKSEGTFLWASLTVRNLECLSSGPDFDAFLKTPPSELQDVYRKILSSLTKRGGSETVLNMIHSVALALRPLTFGELGHILARMEETAKAEQFSHGRTGTKIPPTKEEIRGYVQSSLGFLRATDTTVSLVHHTAREFLFDESHNEELPIPLRSDLTVSWECFQYLHHALEDTEKSRTGGPSEHDNESRGSSSKQDHREEELEETVGEVERKDPQHAAAMWPYLRYAAESWFIHARRSVEIPEDKFYDDSTRNWFQYQFFEAHDIIRKPWIELCGDQKMEILAGDQTKLHLAVSLGLLPLVEKALLDSPKGTDNNWSPLHLAARLMSGAYRILIDMGGRSLLTMRDQDGNTPLHEAVISGHFPMLKGLVKRFTEYRVNGSEINKQNQYGNTPLHLAFQFDHPEIVKFLVEKGADKTIKNKAQVTALEWGREFGRDDSLDTLKQAEKIRGESSEDIMSGPADGSSQPPPQDPPLSPPLDPLQDPPQPPAQNPPQGPQQDSPQDPLQAPPQNPQQAPPRHSQQDPPQVPQQAPPQGPPQDTLQDPPQAPPQDPPQDPPQGPLQGFPQDPPQAPPQDSPQDPLQAPPQNPQQAPPRDSQQDPPQVPQQAPPQDPLQGPLQDPPQAPLQAPPQAPPQDPPQDPPQGPLQALPQDSPQDPLQAPPQNPQQPPPRDPQQDPPQVPQQTPPRDLPQDPPQGPSQGPSQAPSGNSPQDPLQDPPQDPSQDPPQDPPQSPPQALQQDSQQNPQQAPPQAPPQDPPHDPPQDPPHDPPQDPLQDPPQDPLQAPQQDPPQIPQQAPPQDLSQDPLQDPPRGTRRTGRVAPPAPAHPSGPPPRVLDENELEAGSSIGSGENKVNNKHRRGRNRVRYVVTAICTIGILLAVIVPFTRGHN